MLLVTGASYTGHIPHQSTGYSPLPVAIHLRDNPRVQNDREILSERVRERVESIGRSPRDLSIAAIGKPDLIRDILRGKRMPTGPVMLKLAEVLETTTEYLLGQTANRDQVRSEVSIHDVKREWIPEKPVEQGIPLVGTGDCAELAVVDEEGHEIEVERSSFDPEYHVRYIKRPAALAGDRKAYAIYFHGSSMEPRYFAGEIGIVQPDRHAGPGDFVLVQMNDGNEDAVISVLVKQLVRATTQYVELRQYNPPTTFRLPRRQISHMHRIMLPNELLG